MNNTRLEFEKRLYKYKEGEIWESKCVDNPT